MATRRMGTGKGSKGVVHPLNYSTAYKNPPRIARMPQAGFCGFLFQVMRSSIRRPSRFRFVPEGTHLPPSENQPSPLELKAGFLWIPPFVSQIARLLWYSRSSAISAPEGASTVLGWFPSVAVPPGTRDKFPGFTLWVLSSPK